MWKDLRRHKIDLAQSMYQIDFMVMKLYNCTIKLHIIETGLNYKTEGAIKQMGTKSDASGSSGITCSASASSGSRTCRHKADRSPRDVVGSFWSPWVLITRRGVLVTIPRPARAVKARLLGARTAAVTALLIGLEPAPYTTPPKINIFRYPIPPNPIS